MPTNDFVPYASSAGANVEAQAAYITDAQTLLGVAAGTARSAIANKAWRQSSIMASMLGSFIAQFSGQNSVDDGTTATLQTDFTASLKTVCQANLGFTPVQQGTGVGQSAAYTMKIGFDPATNKTKLTLQSGTQAQIDQGNLALENWVTANFAPAGNYQGSGSYQPAGNYVKSQTSNVLQLDWTGTLLDAVVDSTNIGALALQSWVSSLFGFLGQTASSGGVVTGGTYAGQVGYISFKIGNTTVYLMAFRNLTSTTNSAGQQQFTVLFPVTLLNSVIGYSFCGNDEANASVYNASVMGGNNVAKSSMTVTYSRPGAVAGSSCAISGFVMGS